MEGYVYAVARPLSLLQIAYEEVKMAHFGDGKRNESAGCMAAPQW